MGAWEWMLDALQLKLQAVLSSLMCVLGTERGSSEEQQALLHAAPSPQPLCLDF